MFSLFSPKIAAQEVADVLIEGLQKDVGNGQINKPFIDEASPDDLTNIRQEWFYFDAFNVDYFVFLALGQTPEARAILDVFWRQMREWLAASKVPALPERMGPYAGYPGSMKIIPEEHLGSAYDRVRRRCAMYMETINRPHPLGENHSVGLTFGILCGDLDLPRVAGVAGFFHKRKMEWVKMLKSHRIVIP